MQYSGISTGYVWGYENTVCTENRILYNHIYNIGKGNVSDMGGIYTLGKQYGSLIIGNYIHNVKSATYGGWGIYLDEASTGFRIEKNIVYGTTSHSMHIHWGRENIIKNNILAFGEKGGITVAHPYWEPRSMYVKYPECRNIFDCNAIITDNKPMYEDKQGTFENFEGYTSSLNLFYDISGNDPVIYYVKLLPPGETEVTEKNYSFEDVQKMNKEIHSVIAEPGFKDIKNHDFTLKKDSALLKLGFLPVQKPEL